MTQEHYKDAILDELAREHNVAQFVSFGSDHAQRFSRVRGLTPNHQFRSLESAIETLLARSGEHAVNIRSFEPAQPRSREFLQNLKATDEIVGHVNRLGDSGLTTIVNETIDVSDGGVSGVATPQTLEFAPDATPRAVEDEGIAALSRYIGDRLLTTVYGFDPEVPTGDAYRVEFSVHPQPRGWLGRHTLLWERERLEHALVPVRPIWPNKFSRFLGDKTYGLLMAWIYGLPVPRTIAFGRRFAPFIFGNDTGSLETWIRTAPAERSPGEFTTLRGWTDPFSLLQREDPEHRIAAVLSQQAVPADYSGALITEADGAVRIEGVAGAGADFMLTGTGAELPCKVDTAVRRLNDLASNLFGSVSFEWVFDGRLAWLVQLHVGRTSSQGDIIYPGEPTAWLEVSAAESLESLRSIAKRINPRTTGIVLIGSIGTSSHKGDLLRKAQIPSRIRHR